jgi:hypothetical protein
VIPPRRIPVKKIKIQISCTEKCKLPVCRVAIQECIFNVEGMLTNRLVAENRFLSPLFKPPTYIWCPQTIEPNKQIAPILITM